MSAGALRARLRDVPVRRSRVRLVITLACTFVVGCFAACEQTPSQSALIRVPGLPVPTEPSTTEPPPPPVRVEPFRRTIIGTVREANGGAIAGVEIVGSPIWEDRQTATTASDGSFRIGQTVYERLSFAKQNYRHAYWQMPPNTNFADVQTVAVRMQRNILLAAGSSLSSEITADDVTFTGGYPFGDEGQSYECSPCKLIDISRAGHGATLRLSWSGSVPLALWAGDTQSWDGPYVRVVGRPDASELVGSTTSPIDAVLVGLDPGTGVTLGKRVTFKLTVTRP